MSDVRGRCCAGRDVGNQSLLIAAIRVDLVDSFTGDECVKLVDEFDRGVEDWRSFVTAWNTCWSLNGWYAEYFRAEVASGDYERALSQVERFCDVGSACLRLGLFRTSQPGVLRVDVVRALVGVTSWVSEYVCCPVLDVYDAGWMTADFQNFEAWLWFNLHRMDYDKWRKLENAMQTFVNTPLEGYVIYELHYLLGAWSLAFDFDSVTWDRTGVRYFRWND